MMGRGTQRIEEDFNDWEGTRNETDERDKQSHREVGIEVFSGDPGV